MANTKVHCSLDYHEFNGTDIETKGHSVSNGIYGNNPPFTSPPLTQLIFDGLVTAEHNAYMDYVNGGVDQKGAYLTARANLITGLDQTATYVDGIPGVDEAMITLAGFTPTKGEVTKAVVPVAPVIDVIDRPAKGVLDPSCKAVAGTEYYGCIILEQPIGEGIVFFMGQINIEIPGPIPSLPAIRIVVTKSRKKTVPGLTSRKEYWVYFYAGNSAGVSPLSDAVSIVCG